MRFKYLSLFLLLTVSHLAQANDCPRIVSQSPYITKTLQWLGLEQCIVGVSRYDTLDLPQTGGVLDPDAEVIATLEPELLFLSDWTDEKKLASITPPETRAIRLGGFGSMAEIEENLRVIGNATNLTGIEQRVTKFHDQWRQAAEAIHGNGKRVLLLSSCSGQPYSFGKKRWLGDLFTQAGFEVAETEPKIRNIGPGNKYTTLNALIDALHPELLFIFDHKDRKQCAFIKPKTPLRIITLDGAKFLHPSPQLLDALGSLKQELTNTAFTSQGYGR
jgi:ABC-type Fe3+-hydroxamate transport system substrate-binding protein